MERLRGIGIYKMFKIALAAYFLQAKYVDAINPVAEVKNATTDAVHTFRSFVGQLPYLLFNVSADFQNAFPMYPITDLPYPDDYFDFIIVGAGPSGCVIANRLTKHKDIKVLLLEAGEEPSILVEIPSLAVSVTATRYSWNFKPEPQREVCTGNKADYDYYESLGNVGWGYKDVLPLFKRSEKVHVKVHDEEYHGRDGYLSVSDPSYASRVSHAWVQAAQEAGYPYVDYNGENQIGVSFVQSTTLKGRRDHAERGWLRPFRHRVNLVIRKNSLVTKVLIDPKTRRAYGVEYESLGKKFTVTAKKEIILSAGVFNSPKLLMLSGVGPKETLEKFDIPVIKNLPVGKLMIDHLLFPNLMFTVNKPITLNALPFLIPQSYVDHLTYGSGPVGYCLDEVMQYINTNVTNSSTPNLDVPDVEFMVTGGSAVSDFGLFARRHLNVPQSLYDAVWKPFEHTPVFMVVPVLLHPKSRGHMTLISKDPAESPLFFPNYFTDPENHDIKTMIASIREAQRIVKSPSLAKFDAKIIDIPIPGCEQHGFDTDEYWECALRTVMSSIYHQVATCKMGPETDPESVVSPLLKVHGINNLRVADIGVLPAPISGHTMAAAYMIGEKAYDILKEHYSLL